MKRPPTQPQALPSAQKSASSVRWMTSLMVLVTLSTPPALSIAQTRSSGRSEACVVCIPHDYKKACERGLATAKEKGRELDQCEGANEQLGRDRDRERAAWGIEREGLLARSVAAELRAARAEDALRARDGAPWRTPVGWTLVAVGLMWGLSEVFLDPAPDTRQLAGAGAVTAGGGLLLLWRF